MCDGVCVWYEKYFFGNDGKKYQSATSEDFLESTKIAQTPIYLSQQFLDRFG